MRHKNLDVGYEIHKNELGDKDLRFFHLKFVCEQDDKIDEFDDLLRAVRAVAVKTDGQIKVLWDDIAFKYSLSSYPLIYEIENLLRRLIIQFMITNVGVDWDKEALPTDVKENTKKKKSNDQAITSILHETDFIQLADCLFKPYTTKELDSLYTNIEQAKDNSDLNISILKEFIPKSNWTRYFSSFVKCDDGFLNKRWKELYELRCMVAHNNLLNKSNFERIIKLVEEVKPKLQEAILSLDKIKIPDEERDNLAENIASNINALFGEFMYWWRDVESELIRLAAPFEQEERRKNRGAVELSIILRGKRILEGEICNKIQLLAQRRNSIVHGRYDRAEYSLEDINTQIVLLKDISAQLKSL